MYIVGTFSVLALVPAGDVDPKSGVVSRDHGRICRAENRLRWYSCRLAVTVATRAALEHSRRNCSCAVRRRIDRYCPRPSEDSFRAGQTPYVSIIVQAIASALVLLLSQINETTRGAYQAVIDITIILLFHSVSLHVCRGVNLLDVRTAGQISRGSVPEAKRCGMPALWRFRLRCCRLSFLFFRREILLTESLSYQSDWHHGFWQFFAVGLILYFWGAAKKRSEHLRRDCD